MANLLGTLITGDLRTTQGYGTSDSTRILYPGGGSFVTTTTVITGAIRIKMPVFGSGMMMTCTVKVYEYSSNKSFTITFGGHRDSSNWYNIFCYFDGDGNRGDLPVRFGLDDGVNCVWIGETSNQWSYPQVFVTDVQLGYVGYSTTWLSGWSVGFVTSFGTVNRTATAFQKITTTNIGSQSVSFATSSGTFSTNWTNYKGVTENAVAGQLMWKNYGNNHIIFDASNSTSPTGSVVNNANSDMAWTGTYPTLMGWNGANTYGVRVDSSRIADSIISQANSATITAATAATANTIVLRDGNGDIFSRYSFSSYVNTSDNDESSITRFIIKNGDNYHRSATTTVAADIIKGAASGTWAINVTGSAGSITNGVYTTQSINNLTGVLNFGVNNATPYNDATGVNNGIAFGGMESSSLRTYGIFTELENVGGNYSKLTLNYHTGIRIGASLSYGGTRFYNNFAGGSGGGSEIFSVGNGDSNVRVANNLYIGSASGWITDLLAAKQNASTAINTSNISSQTVATAGALSSMNISQFTNNSGYITSSASITGNAASATFARRIAGPERIGFNVGGDPGLFYPIAIYTGAASTVQQYSEFIIERGGYDDPGYSGIAFSTFNARFTYKPSGWGFGAVYFHLEQLTQTAAMLGDFVDQFQSSQAIIWLRGATRYNIYSVYGGITLLFSNEDGGSYSMPYGTYEPISTPREKATTAKYYDATVRYSGLIYTGSNAVIHAGNIGSQSVLFATTAGSAPNAGNQNAEYLVTAGEGNGLKFWASDNYKISMGYSSLYQYGTVTDYSIKTQMNSGDAGRGFTWGRNGIVPIASLNATSGNMQIAGTFAASNFSGSSSGTNTGDQTNISGNAGTATSAATVTGSSTIGGYLTLNVDWGASPYTSAFNIIGTHPSMTFRGSNGDTHYLIHMDNSGDIQYYFGPGYLTNNWTRRYEFTKGGNFSVLTGDISASGRVTGSNLSGTNTGDQTNISGNAATATTASNALGISLNGDGISGMGPISNWDSRPGVGFAAYGINYHTGVTISGYAGYGGVRLYASGYPTHSGSVLRLEASDSVKTYGILYNDTSVRAPIFYDSQDTSYYVDPGGNGTRAAFLNGNVWISPKPESYGEGIAFLMPNQATWGGLRWVRGVSNFTGAWALGYFGDEYNNNIGFHSAGVNGWRLDHSWNMTVVGSVRAPIFYDSNDTTYYGDFASLSRVNEIGANKMRADTNGNYDADKGWWSHDPYGQGWGKPHGSFRSLEVSTSGNFDAEPAMFRIHQWGSGAAEFWKPKGTTLFLRETPGGSGAWFTKFEVQGLTTSDTLGLNNGFRISSGGSNYGSFNSWVFLPNSHGFYSSVNNAHIYPNNGIYGSWRIDGTRNGYNGIEFNASNGNVVLMLNASSNTTGFHNNAYGWQLLWDGGTLYCFKNTYGGGTQATVLDSVNFTTYAQEKENQRLSTGSDVTHNSTTSPLLLVNNHSDNTKGYRIHNTSGSSVSAMFTNSSNQLVIAAGAVDQINLNKKVYVNAVALGVNFAPSATAGRIDASNDIVAFNSSDERLKENITPIANALDKVKSLTGVEFDWKPEHKEAHGHEGRDTGIIAQQVLAVMPTAVRTNDTGFLAVRYEKLIGLLIEGMKEQQEQIDVLKAKLDGLTK